MTRGHRSSPSAQVIGAIQWIAYQYGYADRVALCAYSWRAALHLKNGAYQLPCSTSTLFGVDSIRDNRVRANHELAVQKSTGLLEGKDLLLLDEMYTLSPQHLAACNRSYARQAGDAGGGRDESVLFDGLQVVFFGDPLQHSPPGRNNSPLHRFADMDGAPIAEQVKIAAGEDKKGQTRARAIVGRHLYVQATEDVFRLTNQHRLNGNDAEGQLLYKFSRLFMRDDDANPVRRADVVEFCREVNKKALDPSTGLAGLVEDGLVPHVAILRHKVRQEINLHIVKVSADGPAIDRQHLCCSPALLKRMTSCALWE